MTGPIKKVLVLLIAFSLTAMSGSANEDKQNKKPATDLGKIDMQRSWTLREPGYRGQPLSYWLKAIRDRDKETMPLAFDAIRDLGPEALSAVPTLTRIVAAPFPPIDLGKDSDDLIESKLYEIDIRSEAIDALASIGRAASDATMPMIQWALTVRIIPADIGNDEDNALFIDLVTMDFQERLEVIGAVSEFGDAATPVLTRLLKSSNSEKRKFAVAILGEDALMIAWDLLSSRNCEDVKLGITILSDMEPVVARAYITGIKSSVRCDTE